MRVTPGAPAAASLATLTSLVRAVLDGVIGPAPLANGAEAHIDLSGPTDGNEVGTFYRGLCDTSTYYRFFGIRRALPEEELSRIVTTCLPDAVTLLARLDGSLVGIGQYVPTGDHKQVEVAFAVADDHHHEGIATLMLERLATLARRCGYEQLTAVTLPGNADMRLVFRTAGLVEHEHFDSSDGVIHVDLDLVDLSAMYAKSDERRTHARTPSSGVTSRV